MAQPTRRRLPPLNALRAFEAVARSLSFTKAADQLLVTQSAVSRQVKNLEDILGVQLLKRKGPLELTEEGRKLLPVLTGSFDKIAEVIAGIKATHANPPLDPVAAADLRAAHGDAAPRRLPAQASGPRDPHRHAAEQRRVRQRAGRHGDLLRQQHGGRADRRPPDARGVHRGLLAAPRRRRRQRSRAVHPLAPAPACAAGRGPLSVLEHLLPRRAGSRTCRSIAASCWRPPTW